MKVDFPDPDSPMRAVIELGNIFKCMELIIFLLPKETESDFASSKLRDRFLQKYLFSHGESLQLPLIFLLKLVRDLQFLFFWKGYTVG